MSLFRARLSLLLVVALLTGVPIAAQEGRMVDAGGHKLHMEFRGEGFPTVVFDAGMAGGMRGWTRVRDSVALHTRTVIFERAGFGDSEVGPAPRDARQISSELHTALLNAGVEFPVVLVGHSAGGLFSVVFAGMHREAVAGLVLVDPATDEAYVAMGEDDAAFWDQRADPSPWEAEGWSAPEGWVGQMEALPESVRQFAESWPLPSVPTIVFTAMVPIPGEPIIDSTEDMARWRDFHARLVDRIPGAVHHVLPEADHASILREELLRAGIAEMVAAIQAR